MKDSDQTFALEELDANFWDKVLYVEKWHSSGMGGPGCLWMITSDQLLYQIGFETFPYDENHLERFHSFFEVERYDRAQWRNIYKIESKGWKYIDSGKMIWIKNEYAKEFEEELKKAKKQKKYVFSPEIFAKILGVTGELERVREVNFQRMIDKQQMENDKREKEREKIRLLPKHFEWKALYMNNSVQLLQEGEYALIFKRVNGEMKAYKFSIIYQRQEVKPLQIRIDVPPELYILFENCYSEVEGPYCYPDPNDNGNTDLVEETNTFHNLDINNYGEFVRAFRTMEEAKEYAAVVATSRWQVNCKNLYVPV